MEGGGTKRDHLERIEKQIGKQQIPDYSVPPEGEHIWNWFWELSNLRSQGFGVSLISYTEIRSWMHVRRPLIYDWEIEVLVQMDRAFIETYQGLGKKVTENKGSR
jgi:hypothetical protein